MGPPMEIEVPERIRLELFGFAEYHLRLFLGRNANAKDV